MNKIRNLLCQFFITMVFFVVQKIYFLLKTWQGEITITDVLSVAWNGLKLDAAISSYTMFLPCLLFLFAIPLKGEWTRWILKPYYTIIAILFAVAVEADVMLYPFWHFKLDSSVFLYTDKPKDAMASVSMWYVVKQVISAAIIAVLLAKSYLWVLQHMTARHAPTVRKMVTEALSLLCIIALCVVMARGGIGKGTNNVSSAYFSDNQYLNHAAVNPVFNFLYSLGKQEDFASEARYLPPQQCKEIVSEIYTATEEQPTEQLLTTQEPDILLVIWEGACWHILRDMKAGPFTSALAKESIDFSSCYANSFRTDRGQLSLLSAWPAIPKTSLMKIPEKCEHMAALPRQLLSKGYHTSFWYGGDISFANTGGYMHQAGFEQNVSDKDFSNKEKATDWGVYDGTLLDRYCYEYLNRNKKLDREDKKSFDCIMTLSSHEPWQVPVKKYENEKLNAFYYTDQCLSSLIKRLKASEKWKNLLVIITSDHGVPADDETGLNVPVVTHIPMLWTGGAIKKPMVINTIMNQTDLAATLLAQLGMKHGQFPFSRDILSPAYTYPTALHVFNSGVSFVDSTGYTTFDIDGERPILNPDKARETKAKASLQYIYDKTAEL